MKQRTAGATALLAILFVAMTAFAQVPLIDGSLDTAIYGPALSVQNTETHFGDASQGDQVDGMGSEIDGIYGKVSNGRLFLMVAGNLQQNFNRMEVFFDTRDGGSNQLDGPNLPRDVDSFETKQGALQRMNGLKFDVGFEADYYVTINHGFGLASDPMSPGDPISFWALSAHYSDMTQDAPSNRQNVAAGMQLAPQGLPHVLRMNGSQSFEDDPYLPNILNGVTVPNHLGPALPNLNRGDLIDRNYAMDPLSGHCPDDTGLGCLTVELGFALDQSPSDPENLLSHRNLNNVIDLKVGFDNGNTAGVSGTNTPPWQTTGTPQNVMTGIEFSIPLSEIGNPNEDFKTTVFINGNGHDFVSNQFSGEGIVQGNLGGDGMGNFIGDLSGVDLSAIAGEQFVIIEVTALAGDYNEDGTVNAADYTVWRNNLGAPAGTLPNDVDGGIIGQDQYNTWKANFGMSAPGSGALTEATVPEPTSVLPMITVSLVVWSRRRVR